MGLFLMHALGIVGADQLVVVIGVVVVMLDEIGVGRHPDRFVGQLAARIVEPHLVELADRVAERVEHRNCFVREVRLEEVARMHMVVLQPVDADRELAIDDQIHESRVREFLDHGAVAIVGFRVFVGKEMGFAGHEGRVFFERRAGKAIGGGFVFQGGVVVVFLAIQIVGLGVELMGDRFVRTAAGPDFDRLADILGLESLPTGRQRIDASPVGICDASTHGL